jgi:hypothetical protein
MSERALRYKADSNQTASLFASFVTFLSNKEKLSCSLFAKENNSALSADKEKI